MTNRCEYGQSLRGLLLVVSGPSGVGKDVVLTELANRISYQRCVTATTRSPRDGEIDGVDYTFLSREVFQSRIEANDFLEYADVFGNLYGTPRAWVEDKLAGGIDIVLKIDVQGALNVKEQMPGVVMIFLAPPSSSELERRLRERRTDSQEQISKRIVESMNEMSKIPHYDYLVVNDVIEDAADKIKAVIVAEHCRINK